MECLFTKFFSQDVQDYLYDCLKAAHARMLALESSKTPQTHPWREGFDQVNIVGVRGFRDGVCRGRNGSGEFDDTIFVARIVSGDGGCRKKEVWQFEASLDASSGSVPILLEGCYQYYFSFHKFSFPHRRLTDGYATEHKYRALKCKESDIVHDFNQNNIPDAFESIHKNQDLGINIHFGGTNDHVGLNGSGCQVIRYWNKYQQFIRLVEIDSTIKLEPEEAINELEEEPDSRGNEYVIYTLLEGSFFEHFLQAQSRPPIGDGRSNGWGTIDPFSVHYLESQADQQDSLPNFPVSGSTTWHSGIHLVASGSQNYATVCASGKIIAARLGEPDSLDGISPNFVLMEHSYRGVKVFSLYMHLQRVSVSEMQSIPWLNQGFRAFRATKNIVAFGSRATELQMNASSQLHVGIPAGKIFWICEQPKTSPNITAQATPINPLPPISNPVTKTNSSGAAMTWVVSSDHPQGCWVAIEGNAVEIDPKIELSLGKVVPFFQPVLPGEILASCGNLGGVKGVHFEVFSEHNLFVSEIEGNTPFSNKIAESESLSSGGEVPNWSIGFFITKLWQGDTYAVPGKRTRFSVREVAGGSNEDVKGISWLIRIISDSGVTQFSRTFESQGAFVEIEIPADIGLLWSEVIAQPYTSEGGADPRLVIRRRIIPSRIISVHEQPLIPLEKKAGVQAKLKSFIDACKSNYVTTGEIQEYDKALSLRPNDKALNEARRAALLRIKNPWKFDTSDPETAKQNGYRWQENKVKLFQWWSLARSAGVSLPSGEFLCYFHPLRFLQSLPLISGDLGWLSEIETPNNERAYAVASGKQPAPIEINAPSNPSLDGDVYIENNQVKRVEVFGAANPVIE